VPKASGQNAGPIVTKIAFKFLRRGHSVPKEHLCEARGYLTPIAGSYG
jgi:hypothetical protein